uniref:ATP synthase subunit a n=1 Tax=Perkinsiella saccharicida TaxID=312347 RepID=A0A7S4YZF9_9HEMI|nr:ATP synthase F0 subunit 6 [Perkinsiella saccharicida]QBZ38034.1 ATP synthase F0 subunit 6 [Perkinsiella saccharicida]
MLTNLFSSFDPSTTINIQLNWLALTMILIFIPNKFWIKESRNSMIKVSILKFMSKEMNFIYFNKQIITILKSIFLMTIIINLMGLTPYVFTPTSHLSISMALGLPLWISFMTFSWKNYTNLMFTHLLPMNTPPLIAPFMVVVESLSNLIRPISLSVRLTANMIAGHLLMTLLGNINSIKSMPMLLILQMILLTFEISVAFIQAYVFTILMTMYSSEIP